MTETVPLWVGGRREQTAQSLAVLDKSTGALIARACAADEATIRRGIDAACAAAPRMAALATCDREKILLRIEALLRARAEEFAQLVCAEAGKPICDARSEVARMIDTFHCAAGEAVRCTGEVLPMDVVPRGKDLTAFSTRVPIGPCSFITPFNFPLNLVAHKVAPAIAVGNSFVLKPASLTPLSALLLGEVLAEAGMPEGSFSILPCERAAADLFTSDPRLKLLSFTGSPAVGWALKAKAGRMKVVLELGGNAACIVEPDWDVADAVQRILVGAFGNSGQSCIKTQRLLVHASRYAAVRAAVIAGTRALRCGDAHLESTQVGPLITEADAQRLERWTANAVGRGATLLCGGQRNGAFLEPTVLENVPDDAELSCEEAFGPVLLLSSYDNFGEALSSINHSRFGLQAGVFTRDWPRTLQAYRNLEVGAVIIGDVPTMRLDHMPYGGVKDSGLGREGVRFAMEDMSEPRLLVLRAPREFPQERSS